MVHWNGSTTNPSGASNPQTLTMTISPPENDLPPGMVRTLSIDLGIDVRWLFPTS